MQNSLHTIKTFKEETKFIHLYVRVCVCLSTSSQFTFSFFCHIKLLLHPTKLMSEFDLTFRIIWSYTNSMQIQITKIILLRLMKLIMFLVEHKSSLPTHNFVKPLSTQQRNQLLQYRVEAPLVSNYNHQSNLTTQ